MNEKKAKEISEKYKVEYTTDYREIAEDKKIQILPIQHFVDCVAEGKKPVIFLEEGLNNVKIIEKIVESIEKNQVIEFK